MFIFPTNPTDIPVLVWLRNYICSVIVHKSGI